MQNLRQLTGVAPFGAVSHLFNSISFNATFNFPLGLLVKQVKSINTNLISGIIRNYLTQIGKVLDEKKLKIKVYLPASTYQLFLNFNFIASTLPHCYFESSAHTIGPIKNSLHDNVLFKL